MIQQFTIPLNGALPDWAAYSLYAVLMRQLPEETAQQLHREGFTPVSQYVCGDHWYLTALDQPTADALCRAVGKLDRATIHRLDQQIQFGSPDVSTVYTPDAFLGETADSVTLRFRTPTAFKSGGQYRILPTEQLMLQSLMQKWNSCFADECPIEDEGGGLEAMAQGLVYREFSLESRSFPLKSAQIPGAVGTIRCELRSRQIHNQLTAALLEFGRFSGIGIKTALGMGGFIFERK